MMKTIKERTPREIHRKLMEAMEKMNEPTIQPSGNSNAWLEQRQEKMAAEQSIRDEALNIYTPLRTAAIYIFTSVAALVILGMLYGMWLMSPWVLFGFVAVLLLVFMFIILVSGSKERPPDWAIELVKKRIRRQGAKAIKQEQKRERQAEKQIENQLL